MKRFSALFLLIVLIPLVCTAEDAEKQVRAGIENVMDGLDFDQAADIALDVPGWPEHRSLEETGARPCRRRKLFGRRRR